MSIQVVLQSKHPAALIGVHAYTLPQVNMGLHHTIIYSKQLAKFRQRGGVLQLDYGRLAHQLASQDAYYYYRHVLCISTCMCISISTKGDWQLVIYHLYNIMYYYTYSIPSCSKMKVYNIYYRKELNTYNNTLCKYIPHDVT